MNMLDFDEIYVKLPHEVYLVNDLAAFHSLSSPPRFQLLLTIKRIWMLRRSTVCLLASCPCNSSVGTGTCARIKSIDAFFASIVSRKVREVCVLVLRRQLRVRLSLLLLFSVPSDAFDLGAAYDNPQPLFFEMLHEIPRIPHASDPPFARLV